MSPVFRHGGLRLYLLKLLDEAPRHGYDVIRLLQDKFLGVYSPSPGTIYPRLARLEEEGLVTHETVDGKKIYKITDAGRAELNRRFDDLADLEDELAASVRDIAKEISRDVRETVRNLRDELTFAVREAGRAGRAPGAGPGQSDADARAAADGQADAAAGEPKADQPAAGGAGESGGARAGAWQEATAEDDVSPDLGESRAGAPIDAAPSEAGPSDAGTGEASQPRESAGAGKGDDAGADAGGSRDHRGRGDWREWTGWAERADWREFAEWAKRQEWGEWVGRQDWREWKERASSAGRADWTESGRADWIKGGKPRDRRDAGPDLMANLEHLAAAFAREIRGVARQAENVSDDTLGNLGRVLSDTLNKIRSEVFREPDPGSGKPAEPESGESDSNPPGGTASRP